MTALTCIPNLSIFWNKETPFPKIWNKDTSPFRFHCTQCPNKYNRPDQFRFSFLQNFKFRNYFEQSRRRVLRSKRLHKSNAKMVDCSLYISPSLQKSPMTAPLCTKLPPRVVHSTWRRRGRRARADELVAGEERVAGGR